MAGSTWDLYSYADNDLINKMDPDGRFGKFISDSFSRFGNDHFSSSLGPTWFERMNPQLEDLRYAHSPAGQLQLAYEQTQAQMGQASTYGIFNHKPFAAAARREQVLASLVNAATFGLANDVAGVIV